MPAKRKSSTTETSSAAHSHMLAPGRYAGTGEKAIRTNLKGQVLFEKSPVEILWCDGLSRPPISKFSRLPYQETGCITPAAHPPGLCRKARYFSAGFSFSEVAG